jgi:hypothetical protein
MASNFNFDLEQIFFSFKKKSNPLEKREIGLKIKMILPKIIFAAVMLTLLTLTTALESKYVFKPSSMLHFLQFKTKF